MRIAGLNLPAAALGLALLSASAGAAALDPRPFEAVFALEARGFTVGEALWRVRRVADGFVYETRSKPTGVARLFVDGRRTSRSEWQRIDGVMKPVRYRYDRSARPDKAVAVNFDWARGEVENTRRGETSRMAVPDDTLDKLGYMIVLMDDLRAGKRHVRYHIADGKNRIKIYEFKVRAEERMETALGTFKVLRLVRERDDDERETTIWVAPSLDYMPVRIDHREDDGEEMSIRLRSLSHASLSRDLDAGDAAVGSSRDTVH